MTSKQCFCVLLLSLAIEVREVGGVQLSEVPRLHVHEGSDAVFGAKAQIQLLADEAVELADGSLLGRFIDRLRGRLFVF